MSLIELQQKALEFPFIDAPSFGELREIASGIFWARIPLPFQLTHVNVYLIEDGDGWAIIDTGTASKDAKAAWEALLSGPLVVCPLKSGPP